MDRFQPIDASNSSLGAHLYPSEEVYLLTPGVGLYSGPEKSLPHASGTVYLTSHRLFYIDDSEPHRHSCFVKLLLICETQFFAGFLRSSPKVTIGFKPVQEEAKEEERPTDVNANDRNQTVNSKNHQNGRSSKTSQNWQDSNQGQDWRLNASVVDASADALPTTSWICRVCAFSNTFDPGLNQSSTARCSLCGVTSDVKDLKLKTSEDTTISSTLINSTSTSQRGVPPVSAPFTPSDGVSCPVCTFSNHPSMLRCEMCDSPLRTAADMAQATASYGRSTPSLASVNTRTPTKTPEPPEEKGETYNHVQLSFRKGGDRSFYDTLKSTLKEKRWQRGEDQRSNRSSTVQTSATRRRFAGTQANIDGRSANTVSDDEESGRASTPSRRVGIEGILSAVDLQAREDTSDMQDALRDLEALMMRAKKMVDFAEALNAKLNKQESMQTDQSNDEAANMIRSSLVRLGLPTPAITSDMAKDEMEYYLQLAKELASLLYAPKQPLIGTGKVLNQPRSDLEQSQIVALSSKLTQNEFDRKEGQGIMSLDEIWCIWNRARGVALVSPKDLLAVLPFLSKLTTPTIACKTFTSSGLKVLHTPRFSEINLNFRLCNLLQQRQYAKGEDFSETKDQGNTENIALASISTLEYAQVEACPLHLMNELLSDIEMNLGDIVRDESAGEEYWYLNPFKTLS